MVAKVQSLFLHVQGFCVGVKDLRNSSWLRFVEPYNTECNDWLSVEPCNNETNLCLQVTRLSVALGRQTKQFFLDNIKAREALLEEVKTDIRKRCKDRDVNVTGIFPLAHHSARGVKIVNKRFKGIEKVFNTNKLFNIRYLLHSTNLYYE